MNLQDYKQQYEQLTTKKCLAGKEALEAVKQDGYALRYVKDQTEEICIEAVKQYGNALQFVKDQTEEICLEAVKQYGNALQYVKDQTEEICIEAVKQYRYALQYVNSKFFIVDNLSGKEVEVKLDGKVYKAIIK